jgi:hypothetical protein
MCETFLLTQVLEVKAHLACASTIGRRELFSQLVTLHCFCQVAWSLL